MAISPVGNQAPGFSERSAPATSVDNRAEVKTAATEARGQHQAQQNARILESTLQVSIRSGNDSQALLLRTAIDRINELLAPEKGADALQNAYGEDNSAEGTAGRIVALSTAFFDSYAAQRPGADPEKLVRDFVELIRGGFETGYAEATDILQGLGVFDGEVATGIGKTYDLVHKGLDDFLAARLEELRPADEAPADDVPAP